MISLKHKKPKQDLNGLIDKYWPRIQKRNSKSITREYVLNFTNKMYEITKDYELSSNVLRLCSKRKSIRENDFEEILDFVDYINSTYDVSERNEIVRESLGFWYSDKDIKIRDVKDMVKYLSEVYDANQVKQFLKNANFFAFFSPSFKHEVLSKYKNPKYVKEISSVGTFEGVKNFYEKALEMFNDLKLRWNSIDFDEEDKYRSG